MTIPKSAFQNVYNGTFSISSLSTVITALYAAGGPTNTGGKK